MLSTDAGAMTDEVHPLFDEATRPQPGPVKITRVSFTCSQCHHLQRNSAFEYSQDDSELNGAAFCEFCGYRLLKLGHAETFFSMSSQKTEAEMKDYYKENRNPMHSRKYNNPSFAASLQAIPSEGGRAASNRNDQRRSASPHTGPSSRPSRRSRASSDNPGPSSEGTPQENGSFAPPPTTPASPDVHDNLGSTTTAASRRQVIRHIVKAFMKTSFRVGKRPRTENVDQDPRAMDASADIKPRKWRKWFHPWKLDRKVPMNLMTGHRGAAGAAEPVQYPTPSPTPPSSSESTSDNMVAEEPATNVVAEEPLSREDRVPARREELTAAANAHAWAASTIPRHRLHELTERINSGGLEANSLSSDLAHVLMGMTGGADDTTIPRPNSLRPSDLGSSTGSRVQLEPLPWQHGGITPGQDDSRRSSGSTSATLLNSASSQRGMSRGRNRQSYGRSSTIGRSPLSSSPEQRPSSAGQSSASFTGSGPTRQSSRFTLALDTNHVSGNDYLDDDDDGGPTPRAEGQDITIHERTGIGQSISSVLDRAEERLHQEDMNQSDPEITSR